MAKLLSNTELINQIKEQANALPNHVAEKILQDKNITYTENGTYPITPDEGYDGFSDVVVNVDVEGIDTSDATATSDKLLLNETAYVNGEKIVGTIRTYDGSMSDGGVVDDTLKGLIEGSITNLTISDGVTSIRDHAFKNCLSLTSIEIPNSVTKIGDSAFEYCISLTSIELPNSVTSIGNYAFNKCTSLTSVVIGNSVTNINTSAFYSCPSLTSVVIGNSVTNIKTNALHVGSSANKATIRFLGTTPPTITTTTFNKSYLRAIEVPMSAVDTYKSATNWSNFAGYIVGY